MNFLAHMYLAGDNEGLIIGNFIADMVKPDFDWSGKEEYEARFLNQIKARFE